MKIVLDTNIIVSDFWLRSNAFKILLENFERAGHFLFIPTIVLDEAANKYHEKLRDALQSAERAASLLGKIVDQNIETSQTNLNVEEAVKKYYQFLERKLVKDNLLSAKYVFYPEVNHEQLVKRALSRRKPFSEKGAGYRDALIWYCLLWVAELYNVQNDPIAFISNNTSDFGDEEGRLHSDLIQDLVERKLKPDSVILYPNLKTFVEEQIINLFQQLEHLGTELSAGGVKENWFRENFFQDLSLVLSGHTLDQDEKAASFPAALENLEILEVAELLDYTIRDARKSGSSTSSYVVLETDCRVICKIAATVNKLVSSNPVRFTVQFIENSENAYPKVVVEALVEVEALLIYYEDEGISTEVSSTTLLKCL